MKKRIFSILLAAMLTAPMLFSCAGDTAEETTADNAIAGGENAAVEAETEPSWQYPDKDFAGQDYRILNFDQLWDMYIHMDVAEQTGEILNDAVYNRNRKVEEELNCKIVEKAMTNAGNILTDLSDHAKNSIMAGSDEYEIMQLAVNQDISLVTSGYLMDLMSIEGFQLQETWWDQDIIDATTLNGKLYFASGAANLMAFDSMWCLFFNESMMADYDLEKPYDLVREGKWTIDKLIEYCAAVANLNEDASFTWNKDGSCVWGISAHVNCPEKFYFASGIRATETLDDGSINYIMESDKFYSVIDKLATLLNGKTGMTLYASTTDFDAEAGGYVYVFTTRRSMFMTGEIKAAQLMRDMEDTFGILPYPKYDEAQSEYQTTLVSQLMYLTVPTTNTNLDLTATVSEVMAHDSYTSVIPVYYSSVVEHKGLRNEDSIEMLEIMRANRDVDIAVVFSWNNAIREQVREKLFAGDNQVASIMASQKSVVESNIQKFVEFLNE